MTSRSEPLAAVMIEDEFTEFDLTTLSLEHIRRVVDYVRTVEQDPRLDAVIAALSVKFLAVVLSPIGVKIRSGAGTNFPRIGSYPRGSQVIIVAKQGSWGMIEPGRWMTVYPLWVRLTVIEMQLKGK